MSNQDIIRHELFCQIVKEIHKSNEYLIVGIDVAKTSITLLWERQPENYY